MSKNKEVWVVVGRTPFGTYDFTVGKTTAQHLMKVAPAGAILEAMPAPQLRELRKVSALAKQAAQKKDSQTKQPKRPSDRKPRPPRRSTVADQARFLTTGRQGAKLGDTFPGLPAPVGA